MKCKKCKSEMLEDSHEGISYFECTNYICSSENCNYSITVYENGEIFENE